jgi:hypothetical protein
MLTSRIDDMGLVSSVGRVKTSVYVWRSVLSLLVSNLPVSMAIVPDTTKEILPQRTVHGVICACYSALPAFRMPTCTKNMCVSSSGRSPLGGPPSLAFSTSAVSAAADPFG